MRTFVWVQFIGSILVVTLGLAVFGIQDKWPKIVTWTAGEWAFKIFFSVGFLVWEACLLWAK